MEFIQSRTRIRHPGFHSASEIPPIFMTNHFTSYSWPWRSSWQNLHLPLYPKRGKFALAVPGLEEEAVSWATGRRAAPSPLWGLFLTAASRWAALAASWRPAWTVWSHAFPKPGRSTEGLYVRCTCPVSSTIDLWDVGSQEPAWVGLFTERAA